MRQISNFIQLAQVALPFLDIYRAKSLFNKGKGMNYRFWKQLLENIPEINQLHGPLQRRIQHYLFANSMTTQWFSCLHGHKPTVYEKEAGWYIAAATPIADFLVDQLKYNYDDIIGLLNDKSPDILSSIAQKLHQRSLSLSPHQDLFDKYLDLTLISQAKSMSQSNKRSEQNNLKKITWEKGGYALMLFRTALDRPIHPEEERAIYQLGGLMQLHNDIFDLYRDFQDEIQTIPSTTTNVASLRVFFSNEIEKTLGYFDLLPFSEKSKKQFYLLLSLAINTGYICLDQYTALQYKSNGIFQPSTYSRKELVCDMDDLSKISSTVRRTLNSKIR